MSTLADLKTIGYTVDAQGSLAAVRGFGVATTIQTGDQATIDSLYQAAANPAPPPPSVSFVDEAAANLVAAVQAVIAAPDFPTAQANLKALVQKK